MQFIRVATLCIEAKAFLPLFGKLSTEGRTGNILGIFHLDCSVPCSYAFQEMELIVGIANFFIKYYTDSAPFNALFFYSVAGCTLLDLRKV